MAGINDLIGKPILDDEDTTIGSSFKDDSSSTDDLDDLDLIDETSGDEIDEGEPVQTIETARSLWLRVGGMTTNKRMESMGNTVEEIITFQKFRFIKSITMAVVPLILAFIFKNWIFVGISIFGMLVMWFMDYIRVAKTYESFQFVRQLDFNKFVRMLMPYLRGKEVTLYQAFNKMKDRLDEGTTRTALITLISRMNTEPESREPYEDFALEASGQERSTLIMQTLYDYQRSSNDSTTISELAKLVDQELDRSIDEIIERKDDAFETESYMLGFCILIPAMAYFLAIAFDMLQQFQSNMS